MTQLAMAVKVENLLILSGFYYLDVAALSSMLM